MRVVVRSVVASLRIAAGSASPKIPNGVWRGAKAPFPDRCVEVAGFDSRPERIEFHFLDLHRNTNATQLLLNQNSESFALQTRGRNQQAEAKRISIAFAHILRGSGPPSQ